MQMAISSAVKSPLSAVLCGSVFPDCSVSNFEIGGKSDPYNLRHKNIGRWALNVTAPSTKHDWGWAE